MNPMARDGRFAAKGSRAKKTLIEEEVVFGPTNFAITCLNADLTPRQDLAHPLDQLRLGRGEIGRAGAIRDSRRGPWSILASSAPRLRSRMVTCGPPVALRSFEPWITATRLLRRSAYLSCAFMPRRAQIEFGRDPCVAQARDEPLIVRHRIRVAVEREHDDRAGRLGRRDDRAFDRAQRRKQPRDADRKAGRRNRLRAEARDEPVIAPAAADRAEADRPAVVVLDLEGQLRLEDGAGVIFEPANDGGIDTNLLCPEAR